MNIVTNWLKRHFSDPEVVVMLLLLAFSLGVIVFFGDMVAPAIAAVIFAFLLDGAATRLRSLGLGNTLSVSIVFILFLVLAIVAFFGILPPILNQFAQFFTTLPDMVTSLQGTLMDLPKNYPDLVSEEQVKDVLGEVRSEVIILGQSMVKSTVGGLGSVISWAVYLVLVPVMVFFFLKDKKQILGWIGGFLPSDSGLAKQVWQEAVAKAGDYARGKVYEILIVGSVSWAAYSAIDLRFAAFLALLTGLSVIIPYIGAALVTIPVAFVGLFQWGFTSDAGVVVIVYLVLQALDGNLLAPLLFSEVVKLHPNAIILAILIFGGIWGLWGVFFAIPLGTVAQAVIKAWSGHAAESVLKSEKALSETDG